MRNVLLAAVVLAYGWTAAGQTKLSPRLAMSAGSGYLVQFREGADMARVRRWLLGHGFNLMHHPDLRPNDLLVTGARSRLGDIASREDVAYILPASVELITGERVIACGGAITQQQGQFAGYTDIGRGWSKEGDGPVALHYVIESLTGKLEANAAVGEIERAFREWEKYGAVTLSPATAATATRTVAISFVRGEHGDGLPFDGRSGTLAHTYYPAPPNPEMIAGDMHLDADEDWHIGTATDLYTVVLHETGHALGLGHSDQPGAVMYPYYRFAYGLTSDDIAGIQDLYGSPVTLPPPPTPAADPAPAPAPPPPGAPPAAPTPPPTSPPVMPPSTDRTPPSLRIASPATTAVSTSAATLAISGTATDETGVVAVKWTTSSGDSGVATGTASWSASIPLYVGNTVVTVRAFDAAGNSGWRALTVTRR
jgi:hypothetical protein